MTFPISFDLELRKNPYPGKFIAFEGVDGSGKSSQISRLIHALGKENIVATKEPTDMVIGKFIREEILSGKTKISPIALQYLFNADRAMHLEKIEQQLQEGKIVIMDRYFWSSVAYAIADMDGVGDMYLTAFSILSFYNQFIVPDVTFYLDIPLEVALKRMAKSAKHHEMYDKKEKLVKIIDGYKFLLQKFPQEFTSIDANHTQEEIEKEISEKVKRII